MLTFSVFSGRIRGPATTRTAEHSAPHVCPGRRQRHYDARSPRRAVAKRRTALVPSDPGSDRVLRTDVYGGKEAVCKSVWPATKRFFASLRMTTLRPKWFCSAL